MNSKQFLMWLRKQGIEVGNLAGTGHKELFNPATGKWSQIPMHGGRKQLGIGLTNKIKKDLGLK